MGVIVTPTAPMDEDETTVPVAVITLRQSDGTEGERFESRDAFEGENMIRFKEQGDEFLQRYPYARVWSVYTERQSLKKWNPDEYEKRMRRSEPKEEPDDER